MIEATIFLLLVTLLITKMIFDVRKYKKIRKEDVIINDEIIQENNLNED